ncbi:hypothetical protein EI94DRAFT_1813596 [Lactarius quietus]|nr:hypothetical protein EI94DRAFT_1813596 [Lactarius quietus]
MSGGSRVILAPQAGCALTACLLAAASSFTGFIVDFTVRALSLQTKRPADAVVFTHETTINIHILLPQLVSFNTYAYNPTRLVSGLSPLSSSSSSALLFFFVHLPSPLKINSFYLADRGKDNDSNCLDYERKVLQGETLTRRERRQARGNSVVHICEYLLTDHFSCSESTIYAVNASLLRRSIANGPDCESMRSRPRTPTPASALNPDSSPSSSPARHNPLKYQLSKCNRPTE